MTSLCGILIKEIREPKMVKGSKVWELLYRSEFTVGKSGGGGMKRSLRIGECSGHISGFRAFCT